MLRETDRFFKPYPDPIVDRQATFLLHRPALEYVETGDPRYTLVLPSKNLMKYGKAGVPRSWLLVNSTGGQAGFFENTTFVDPGTADLTGSGQTPNSQGEYVVDDNTYATVLQDQQIPLPPPDESWQTVKELYYISFWRILVAMQYYFDSPEAKVGQARVMGVGLWNTPVSDREFIQTYSKPKQLQDRLVQQGVRRELITHLDNPPPGIIEIGQLAVQAMLGMRRLAQWTKNTFPATAKAMQQVIDMNKDFPSPDGTMIWSFRTQAMRVDGGNDITVRAGVVEQLPYQRHSTLPFGNQDVIDLGGVRIGDNVQDRVYQFRGASR